MLVDIDILESGLNDLFLLDCCSMSFVLYLRTECRVRIHKGQSPTLGPSEIVGRGRGLIVGHVVENLLILVPRRPSSPNTQQCSVLLCEGVFRVKSCALIK